MRRLCASDEFQESELLMLDMKENRKAPVSFFVVAENGADV